MLEGLSYLFSSERPTIEILRDFADILIVAFIVYRALVILKGTRAMQMGLGFLAFGGLYMMAKYAQLATLMQVLSWLASSAILILVVVFQNDIRRALIRVGEKAWLSRGENPQEKVIDAVVAAATDLMRHRWGALICMERDASVLEFVRNDDGIELDSVVTKELLVALFNPHDQNPTHDGAIIISNLRITHAGMVLPTAERTRVNDVSVGTRHRAAIGISEETDAVVVVVSEERGVVSLVSRNGQMESDLTPDKLRERLLDLFGRKATKQARKLPFRKVSFKAKPLTVKATDKKEPKSERKTDRKTDPKVGRASVPPPSERTTSPSLADTKKGTKQSGGFRAMKRSPDDTSDLPAAVRVSVPMPSAKDRKSSDDVDPDPDSAPNPVQVSKPMTPADLPNRPSHPGDDS